MGFSPKQIDFLKRSTTNWNVASGSIRSGKSYVANLSTYGFLINDAVPEVPFLFCGKKGDTIENNITLPILALAEAEGTRDRWKYVRKPNELTYLPKNIRCICAGANDESAEERIRGLTAQGMCADEATLYPESFLKQAIGRVSAEPRWMVFTLNPDSPSHYIKTDIIDQIERGELDGRVWYFGLDDNPGISEKYKQDIRRTFSGVYYQRFIEGRWVAAEGAVYDTFSRTVHVVNEYPERQIEEYVLGIDWGYENPMAILLFGVTADGVYYCIDEYVKSGVVVNEGLAQTLRGLGWFNLPLWRFNGVNWQRWETEPSEAYADNNRPESIAVFQEVTGIRTNPANKPSKAELIQGVQRKLLGDGDRRGVYYLSKCVTTIKERESYRWKPGSKDDVVKENDHTVDAEQYIYSTREQGRVRMIQDIRRR